MNIVLHCRTWNWSYLFRPCNYFHPTKYFIWTNQFCVQKFSFTYNVWSLFMLKLCSYKWQQGFLDHYQLMLELSFYSVQLKIISIVVELKINLKLMKQGSPFRAIYIYKCIFFFFTYDRIFTWLCLNCNSSKCESLHFELET